MKPITIEEVCKACGGNFVGPKEKLTQVITGVVKDNREVKRGDLFVPFRGANVDAHRFIPAAYEAGAAMVLSEEELTGDVAYIKVDSCFQALKDIAAYYRKQLTCKIIGVIGSVGKTSTKEMVASVLGTHYSVQKTAGNLNNEIGLPLTILSIEAEHEIGIVEMGISDFGEMTRLSEIARPDMVVMTNIGDCHLEMLHDRDGVLKAKTEVLPYISQGGLLVLNDVDEKLATVKAPEGVTRIGYGFTEDKVVYATGSKAVGDTAHAATIHVNGEAFDVTIPLPGEHNLYNAMAAVCVGWKLGLSIAEMKQGIESVGAVSGRNNRIEKDGCTIIDDCYNANPASMRASLSVLANAKGRKIAVLGDMGELGEREKELHYEIGFFAAEKGINVLFCTGELSKEMVCGAEAAKNGMCVKHFETKEELVKALLCEKRTGDTILIKASHFMRYETVVAAL
ncbi:MAG: UDP-N-acetylmuramoyl-tripeptide--D-alanyl-D-alanine ligase [Lachnospiraceae bacterium]|jgi:UDP-N-acetylmuramoyl-tripeptide--D-alanyl-D-alanine ligase|nr:UDP-N-acetylmuramoyl-tripeptide--D-alanyl-D-alanine ligase [Lachnospiraceae bacterium]